MVSAFLILLPLAFAPAAALLSRRSDSLGEGCVWLICGAESALALTLPASSALSVPGILGLGLSFGPGGMGRVYCAVTALLWLGCALFSRDYFRHEPEHLPSYRLFFLLTLGATEGLFLSADFFTAYVFFEILSLSSFPWVAHERTEEALRAAKTYLAVAVIGGLVLLMGLLLLQNETGTLVYQDLPAALPGADPERVLAAGVCILLGFGAKAGLFPLHIWLPRAHPVAPAPASALLSGILTKAGVFGVVQAALYVLPGRRSFGLLLLGAALITMVLGAVLALFSVNLKRTLACSSMSQIGFILTGVACAVLLTGDAASEALSGAMAHMVNHSVLKLVLFLCAGTAAMNLHTLDLNDLRGWGRNKGPLKVFFALGALGISGVPGLNGYLSKTLLHEGLAHLGAKAPLLRGAEWVFLLSGGMTFAYMLKLFICLFAERNRDPARQARFDGDRRCMSPLSAAVVGLGALALLPLGQPRAALSLTARMTGTALSHFAAFSRESLQGGLLSLGAGALLYLLIARRLLMRDGVYLDRWPRGLDLEERVYRPLLLSVFPSAGGRLAAIPGENRVLRPLCRALELLAAILGRGLDTGTDGLILLLRRTLLREERVRDGRNLRRVRARQVLRQATAQALSPLTENFTFAMLMTCGGIIFFLGMLLSRLLR